MNLFNCYEKISFIPAAYNNSPCGFIEDDEHLFRVMPQLIGAVQTALPSKIVRNDDGRTETKTYSYEFYEDGYIKSCTEISSDGDTSVYGFVWE